MNLATPPLLDVLQRTLQSLDHHCARSADGAALVHPDGFLLRPHLVAAQDLPDGTCSTSTLVQVFHPTLLQDGLFEYQHAHGATPTDALAMGFRNWARMDLVTLLESALRDVERCPIIEMAFDASHDHADAHIRQVLLGPVVHYRAREAQEAEAHAFCPCCLFTHSMEAFTDLLKAQDFLGVRLYASRDDNGLCEADCRVNGEDFPAALPLLQQYAAGWPQAGMEFRKQYVVIRTKPPPHD